MRQCLVMTVLMKNAGVPRGYGEAFKKCWHARTWCRLLTRIAQFRFYNQIVEIKLCTHCDRAVTESSCPVCGGHLEIRDKDFFIGKTLGKYRITGLIGVGGMGVVYEAVHVVLERPVALKMVMGQLDDEKFIERFRREAKVLAEMDHPGIVDVFDFDVSSWGIPYYVMARLRGQSLSQLLRKEKTLTPDRTRSILQQTAVALDHAHGRGIVHRDLKPENIYLTRRDGTEKVTVLDFGLASKVETNESETKLTRTGFFVGTPAYMAPEQISDELPTPATDQYALALIAFEMLTGEKVRFGLSNKEIILQLLRAPLSHREAFVALPETMQAVLERATALRPEERFPSVLNFFGVLFSGDTPTVPMPTPYPLGDSTGEITQGLRVPASTSESRPKAFRLGIASLIILASLIGAFLWQRNQPMKAPTATSQDSLQLAGTLPLPSNLVTFWGLTEDNLMVTDPHAVLLLDPSTGQLLARSLIPAEAEILQLLADGRLVIRQDGNLDLWHVASDEHEAVAAIWGSAHRPVSVSPAIDSILTSDETGYSLWDRESAQLRCHIIASSGGRIVTQSQSFFVLAQSDRLEVYDRNCQPRFQAEGTGSPVQAVVSLREDLNLLAFGGWYDEITLVNLHNGEVVDRFPRPGQTHGLAIFPDGPTVLVAKPQEVVAWRPGKGEVAAYDLEGSIVNQFHAVPNRSQILAFDDVENLVYRLGWNAPGTPAPTVTTDRSEFWSAVGGPNGAIYAGSAFGNLSRYRKGETKKFELHTQGITAVHRVEDRLITISDDRTLAQWSLPDLTPLWQEEIHGSLINYLHFDEANSELWTASSDSTLKRWRWPSMDPLETLSLPNTTNHAFWVSPAGDRVVAGTWNQAIQVLTPGDSAWTPGNRWSVPCESIYWEAYLEEAQAVLFVGLSPYHLYLYDIPGDRLGEIQRLGLNGISVAPLSGREAMVVGLEGWLRLQFERREDTLFYSIDESFWAAGLGNMNSVDYSSAGRIIMVSEDTLFEFSPEPPSPNEFLPKNLEPRWMKPE